MLTNYTTSTLSDTSWSAAPSHADIISIGNGKYLYSHQNTNFLQILPSYLTELSCFHLWSHCISIVQSKTYNISLIYLTVCHESINKSITNPELLAPAVQQ